MKADQIMIRIRLRSDESERVAAVSLNLHRRAASFDTLKSKDTFQEALIDV